MPADPVVVTQLLVVALCGLGAWPLLVCATRSSRMLGVLLLLLACQVSVLAAQELGLVGWHLTPAHLAGLAYGPLFAGFLRALLFRRASSWLDGLPHAAPAAVYLIALSAGLLSGEALALGVFASLGAYLLVALLDLLRYRAVIERTYSNVPHLPFAWLLFAVVGFLLIYALDVGTFIATHTGGAPLGRGLAMLLFATLFLYAAGFVIAALRFPRLFVPITVEDIATAEALRSPDAPVSEGATAAEAAAALSQVEAFMTEHRPFLRSDLTLAELAREIGLPARRLSQLVNRGRGRNFADWVSQYRVEEAKRLLADPQSGIRSVLDAMYAAGFSSKSTFNASFKASAGLTPTEFMHARRAQTGGEAKSRPKT